MPRALRKDENPPRHPTGSLTTPSGETISYTIYRSRRRTFAIMVRPSGEVLVRAPQRASEWRIQSFAEAHAAWLETALAKAAARKTVSDGLPPITADDLKQLKKSARQILPARVAHQAARMGVTYGKLSFRAQRTRWGSCSSVGNLSFNILLLLAPKEVLDYVIIHELCHRRHMDHSPAFWREVERYCPDWRTSYAWLKEQGPYLIDRMERGRN